MNLLTAQRAIAFAVLGTIFIPVLQAMAGEPARRVKTVPVPEGGRPVVARAEPEGAESNGTASNGTVHLLYETDDGLQYAASADQGETFSAPIAVVDRRSTKPGLEFSGFDMAIGKGGRVHVAMISNGWKLKIPVEEWAFYYATLAPGAKTFSKVRNINRTPSEGFSLAADDKGNVTACWLSDKLYANVSHDEGTTFDPTIELDPEYNPCNCCTTSAVYAADGKLAVLYREETDDERDMFLVLWDQRSNRVSRTRVGSTSWTLDACPMTYYAITRSGDGFLAVWPTKGQIYFSRLDGEGRAMPPVEIETPGRSGMRTGMIALGAPDGSVLIAWKNDDRVGWQLYDEAGAPTGSRGSAPSRGNGVAGIVDRDGDFVLFL
jgi:hypothetical protein